MVSDAAARKFLGAACALDAESTLSNVTSIQSQLLSLYETCDDTLKLYDKFSNTAGMHAAPAASAATAQQQAAEQHARQTPIAAARKPHSQQQAAAAAAASNSGNAAAAAAESVVSPTKSGGTLGKTATILVSKSKTKTGLPLLLKNSINN